MSMTLITRGLKKVEKQLARDLKQARFAAAVALSRTAYTASLDVKEQAKKDLDSPTPFTLRGFRYRKATKTNLQAAVYIAPIQSEYLRYQIEGGRRKARARTGEAVPINIRLNRYGNIPGRQRGKVGQLMARKDTFVGYIGGEKGLWQRTGGKKRNRLKLLARFEPFVRYPRKFDFYGAAARSFDRNYQKEFDKAYAKALRTAR